MSHIDNILSSTIGDFGRSQLLTSILMGSLKLTMGWFQLSIIFLAPYQKFWCKNKEIDEIYSRNETNFNKCSFETNLGTLPCANFEYDTSILSSTIVSEWDLVCSKRFFVELTQMLFMIGNLLGYIVFGAIADKYGRKVPLIVAVIGQGVSCLILSFSPNIYIFLISRFVLGTFNGGVAVISIVICIEIVGGKWRTIIPILYQIPFAFGAMILAGSGYILRDWRHIQLLLSILSSVLIVSVWFLPESPRWLLVTNQKEKAFKTLKKIAKFNKMEWDENIESHEMFKLEKNRTNDVEVKKNNNFKQLLSNKKLLFKTGLMCIEWFGFGIIFNGFTQYMGTVSKSIFVMVAMSGVSTILAIFLSLVISQYFGRKKIIIYFEIITAICFILILAFPKDVYPHDWPRVLFSSLAVFGLSTFFPVLSLYTGEIFPTLIRNLGIGVTLTAFKIGSVVAPLVLLLENVAWYLPLTIMGVLTVVFALIIVPLPETKDQSISDIIENN